MSSFGLPFRLIDEGKLMDALALSDRFLRKGASDQLLQLLIERGEENQSISGHVTSFSNVVPEWFYNLLLPLLNRICN